MDYLNVCFIKSFIKIIFKYDLIPHKFRKNVLFNHKHDVYPPIEVKLSVDSEIHHIIIYIYFDRLLIFRTKELF